MDARRKVLAIGGPGWSRRAGSGVGHGAGFPGQWRLQVHAEGSPATLPCRRPAHVLSRARTWMEAEELGRRPPLGSCPHGSPVLFLSFFGRSTSIHFVFADPNMFSVVDCTWCSRFILFFYLDPCSLRNMLQYWSEISWVPDPDLMLIFLYMVFSWSKWHDHLN
jgi:hypothetical protein